MKKRAKKTKKETKEKPGRKEREPTRKRYQQQAKIENQHNEMKGKRK